MSHQFKLSRAEQVRLTTRLAQLKAEDARATRELAETTNNGAETWHDNAGFDAAKDKKNLLDISIRKFTDLLAYSQIVEPGGDVVDIGTEVRYHDANTGEEYAIKIAGDAAGAMGAGWASHHAPLAQGLLGAKVGDSRQVQIGARHLELTILHIAPVTS